MAAERMAAMLRFAVVPLGILCLAVSAAFATPPDASAGACVDPTPDGGGEPAWFGVGTPNHIFTQQGSVCPGETETWTVSLVELPGVNQYYGSIVTRKAGSTTTTVEPQFGEERILANGEEYRGNAGSNAFVFTLRVTGSGSGLSAYSIQLCRAIIQDCVFAGVPAPTSGDASCDGVINVYDAQVILAFVVGNVPWPPCVGQARVNPGDVIDVRDSLIILQYVAGLIDELPVG
jgi:hypothetical protein